jgi:hypothetical protein
MPWVAWMIGMLALAVTLALVVLNHGYSEDALFLHERTIRGSVLFTQSREMVEPGVNLLH